MCYLTVDRQVTRNVAIFPSYRKTSRDNIITAQRRKIIVNSIECTPDGAAVSIQQRSLEQLNDDKIRWREEKFGDVTSFLTSSLRK